MVMRLTVLGGCGAWPEAGQACSGFLVEHDGFRLLVDAGYATMPKLLEYLGAEELDAVFISHGHPDHCADLNPLLRARVLRDDPAPPMPLYAPPGALDAVLALDSPRMMAGAYTRHDVGPGDSLEIGPFRVLTRLLPHSLPNNGVRLDAGGTVLAYTGDTGPAPEIADLARDADLLVADASFVDEVPEDLRRTLSSARLAGQHAARAGAGHLLLSHLLPGTDRHAALVAANSEFGGDVSIAAAGLVFDLR
jgi:ribonuclease BN (tRNA processing enzyme)